MAAGLLFCYKRVFLKIDIYDFGEYAVRRSIGVSIYLIYAEILKIGVLESGDGVGIIEVVFCH